MGATRHHHSHNMSNKASQSTRNYWTWGLGLAVPFLLLFLVFPTETLFYNNRRNVITTQLQIPFRTTTQGSRSSSPMSLTQGDGGLHSKQRRDALRNKDDKKQITSDQHDADNHETGHHSSHPKQQIVRHKAKYTSSKHRSPVQEDEETLKERPEMAVESDANEDQNRSNQMTRKAMGLSVTHKDAIEDESESTEDQQQEGISFPDKITTVSNQRKPDQAGKKSKKKSSGIDEAFLDSDTLIKDTSHGSLAKQDQVVKSQKGAHEYGDAPTEELMDLQSEPVSRNRDESRNLELMKEKMDSDAEEHAEKMLKGKKKMMGHGDDEEEHTDNKMTQEEELDELTVNDNHELGHGKQAHRSQQDSVGADDGEDVEAITTSRVIGKTLPSLAGECALSKGKWVHDKKVYSKSNSTCPWSFGSQGKDCNRYMSRITRSSWRWQPVGCNMDNFEAHFFLELVQKKSLAFVGGNLAKLQMVSLLCLLSQVETPILVYDDNANKSMSWNFPSSNFTLLMIWSPYLVQEVNEQGYKKLHLDKLDTKWAEQVPRLDVVVLGVGELFIEPTTYVVKNEVVGCYSCENISSFDTTNIREISLYSGFRASIRSTILGVGALPGHQGLIIFMQPFGFQGNGSYINVSMKMKEILKEEIEKAHKRGSIANESIMEVLDTTLLHTNSSSVHFLKGPNLACLEPNPFVDTWNHFLQHALQRLSS